MKHTLDISVVFKAVAPCVLISISMLNLCPLFAQQTPLYSLQPYSLFGINPAYAGFEGSLSVAAVIRTQWNQITDNPISQYVEVHRPLNNFNSAIGFSLDNETLGAWQQSKIGMAYNHTILLDEQFIIALGLRLSAYQITIDGTKLRTKDGLYDQLPIDHNDPVLPLAQLSTSGYSIGSGIYLAYQYLELGLSAQYLNSPVLTFNQPNLQNSALIPSFNLSLKYRTYVNQSIHLTPSLILRTNFVRYQLDGIVYANYNNNLMFGIGYRGFSEQSRDGVLLSFGTKLSPNLWLRYAHDVGVSTLSVSANGSHELSLNYSIPTRRHKAPKRKIIYNPRYFD